MKYVNLFEISNPKQWKTISQKELVRDGFPVYGANGVIGYYDEYNHEKSTIVIGCRGSCGEIHITKPKSYITGNAMALDDLDVSKVNKKYLYYYLNYRGFKDVITGTSQPQITQTSLKKIEIPAPPLKVQQQIVEILDEADALSKKREKTIEKLNKLKGAIFYDTFGDPLDSSKYQKHPLSNVVDFISGATPRKSEEKYWNGKIIWVSPKDMKSFLISNSQEKITELAIEETNQKLIPSNTVLLVTRSGILKKLLPVGISQTPLTINQDMKALTPLSKEIIDPYFLATQLKLMEREILASVRSFTADNLSTDYLKSLEIIMPEFSKQSKFGETVKRIYEQLNLLKEASAVSHTLYNSLLQKAFKGDLIN